MPLSQIVTACTLGRHRPKVRRSIGPAGELRTTCRDCGCALVKRPSAPGWSYSGWLG